MNVSIDQSTFKSIFKNIVNY